MAARPGKKIDYKRWEGIPAVSLNAAAIATLAGSFLSFTQSATILRCRVADMLMMFGANQVAGDQSTSAWGLGIFSSDAVAAGVGSLPDPGQEPNYPWLWWGEFNLRNNLGLPVSDQAGPTALRFSVDTKAMRRIHPGQSIAWVIQQTSNVGAVTVNYDLGQTRVLVGT